MVETNKLPIMSHPRSCYCISYGDDDDDNDAYNFSIQDSAYLESLTVDHIPPKESRQNTFSNRKKGFEKDSQKIMHKKMQQMQKKLAKSQEDKKPQRFTMRKSETKNCNISVRKEDYETC